MKVREIILEAKTPEAPKPRNFVAKHAKTGGAGAHKDKKKAAKQGDVKHKGKVMAEGTEPNVSTLDAVFNEHDFDRLEHIWPALEAGDKEEALRQINHYLRKGKNRAWWGDLQAVDIKIDSSDVENSQVMWSKPIQQGMEERIRDPEDWDEGNKEPPNNFAITINGKQWKVFQGNGYYADDQREMNQFYKLKDWCRKKSEQTGKKWEVFRTGEKASESVNETATGMSADNFAVGAIYPNKKGKTPKNKDGTAKNALDMKANLLTGGSIKR